MINLRQRLETMWITVDGTMADHLTNPDVERILSHCKDWALELIGEDVSNEGYEWGYDWNIGYQKALEDARKRVEESLNLEEDEE